MLTAVLFDLDGVLYQGEEVIPGAPEAVAWFQGQQIPHVFLTNVTSRPRCALVEKLARLGINVAASQILTPPLAATHWLRAHTQGDVALFVPAATREEFQTLPLAGETAESGVAAVVVGDLGEGWNFATLNRAFRLLITEPKPVLIALGMTRYWRAEDGLRLDTAPFVVALEVASGTRAIVLGKPAAPFFQAALDLLGVTPETTAMVGDDIHADIESAQRLGLHGILVQTGKFRLGDLEQGIKPDAVLGSIAELPNWWQVNSGR